MTRRRYIVTLSFAMPWAVSDTRNAADPYEWAEVAMFRSRAEARRHAARLNAGKPGVPL